MQDRAATAFVKKLRNRVESRTGPQISSRNMH